MSLPPRFVSVLCLVQVFFVIAGYFVTGSSLRIYDQVAPDMLGPYAPRIPPLSQFVRSFGLWCLLIPFVWCLVAASSADAAGGDTSITLLQFIVGLVATAAVAVAFSLSALYAIHLSFGPP